MSEETTQAVQETADTVEAPQLGIADLKLMANIIDVVSNRGAIKANEMQAVGTLYNNLMTFLVANGAIELPQPEAEEENQGESNDD